MSYLGPEPARALIDQSAIAPDVQVPFLSSRKNKIINGAFDIWQRGISQTVSGFGSDDRWTNQSSGSTFNHSQQSFTLGQTDVPGNPKYYSRTVVTSSPGAGNFAVKDQKIENVKTLSGEIVTLSFWAKADSAKDIATELVQEFGTGGVPSADVNVSPSTHSLTTSWQKFTVTVTLPSISGKALGTDDNDTLRLFIWLEAGSSFDSRTNNLGQQSGTFDISDVQLEKGSLATDFEQLHIGNVLSQCQRYYWRQTSGSSDADRQVGVGVINNSGIAVLQYKHPVVMRTFPTIAVLSNLTASDGINSGSAATTFSEIGINSFRIDIGVSLTAGNGSFGFLSTTSDYIEADAEL